MSTTKTLSKTVADKIEKQIICGNWEVGSQIPTEPELMAKLNVSRITVREAIKSLVSKGILEIHRGRGTFVSQQVEEIGDFGFSSLEQVRGQLRDLFELRSMFEPRCAALACRRAIGRVSTVMTLCLMSFHFQARWMVLTWTVRSS